MPDKGRFKGCLCRNLNHLVSRTTQYFAINSALCFDNIRASVAYILFCAISLSLGLLSMRLNFRNLIGKWRMTTQSQTTFLHKRIYFAYLGDALKDIVPINNNLQAIDSNINIEA